MHELKLDEWSSANFIYRITPQGQVELVAVRFDGYKELSPIGQFISVLVEEWQNKVAFTHGPAAVRKTA